MNPLYPLLGMAGLLLGRKLLGNKPLTWKTVQAWIATNSHWEEYGRGYAGQRLSRPPTNAFVDIRKEVLGNKLRVSAALFPRDRADAVARFSWEADALDAELESRFGNGQRFRVKV